MLHHKTESSTISKFPLVSRPIYAGNALETVQCSADSLQMLSVRTTAFEKAATHSSSAAAVEPVSSDDLSAAQVLHVAMQSWLSA